MMIKGLPKHNIGLKVAGLTLGLAGLCAIAAQAAAPAITGSVEVSANRNFNKPDSNVANMFHSYDPQGNTFQLNNAHLAMNGSDSATGLGYAVETDFGSDAAANAALASGGSFGGGLPGYAIDLQEAYVTWGFGAGRAWGLKAGKYATYEGIEVVEGGANPTITRGFLFGLAEPVSHTGLEINMAQGPLDVHLGVINGWDQAMDVNAAPSYLAKVGYNMGNPLAVSLSAIIGPELAGNTDDMRMSFDLTAVTKTIPMTDLWLQANYGMEAKSGVGGEDGAWLGFGVQPLVHFNDWFGLGLRYEYFMDDKLTRTGSSLSGGQMAALAAAGTTDLTLQNFTIAPTIWLTKTAMVRAEFRMDMASEDVFADSDGKATGSQLGSALDFVLGF